MTGDNGTGRGKWSELLSAGAGDRRPRGHEEDDLQRDCVAWFDMQYRSQPRLRLLLLHTPNEGRLRGGAREGHRRKLMGVRAGVADLLLLVPNREYSYLAVELKTATGRQSASQLEFARAVEMSGGCYLLIRSVEAFARAVRDYLSQSDALDKLAYIYRK